MINGRTRLHVVANGTMTGQRYIDEVLLPHVRLFGGAVGDKCVFMDDNATCHRTLAVQDCLDSEGIQRLVWPVCSPNLNPIENVWDALERQVAGRNYPPTNKNTLIRALTEEWDKLPQQLLDNVVQSMPNGLGRELVASVVESQARNLMPLKIFRVETLTNSSYRQLNRSVSFFLVESTMLAKNFKKYFLDEDSLVASYEWIRDLFQDTPEELSTSEEEIFIDFTSSEKLKGNFVMNRSLNLG
ncbi:transposable element Tc1 transposase [Trichonephila clavipes]|nr:transposable element Tc1 transposase [Trichonephila clavipes]